MRATKSATSVVVERVVERQHRHRMAHLGEAARRARRRPCATGSPACAGRETAPRSRRSAGAARRIRRPKPSARPPGNSPVVLPDFGLEARVLALGLASVILSTASWESRCGFAAFMAWNHRRPNSVCTRFCRARRCSIFTPTVGQNDGGIHTQPGEAIHVIRSRSSRQPAPFLQYPRFQSPARRRRRLGLRRKADAEAKLPDPMMWAPLDADALIKSPEGSHQRVRLRARDAAERAAGAFRLHGLGHRRRGHAARETARIS